MPRYCAVKVCRNRRGTAFRQDNKRVSFYPFPLHDEARLERWVTNMRRRGWTPSRHQYLCSEHFTDDCFDIRWGIRYLKNTAIPNIFSLDEDSQEADRDVVQTERQSLDKDADLDGFDSPLRNRLLVSSEPCRGCGDGAFEPPLRPHVGLLRRSARGVADGGGDPSGSPRNEPPHKELAESAAIVLRCEKPRPLCEAEADVNSSLLEAALGQAFSVIPVVMVVDDTGGGGYGEGEHVSTCEHSYSRPDTDKHQLWGKIFNLHAKILDLDRREESTVAKINALETEISHLKRDSAVCKAKQKILEDIISSKLV